MQVDRARLERLEADRALAEIIVADQVEIVLADIDGQVLAPIVGDALIGDVAALLEAPIL